MVSQRAIDFLSQAILVDSDEIAGVLADGVGSHYSSWQVRKKDGGRRTITSPSDGLKAIQRALLHSLFSRFTISPIAHGSVGGRSVASNAEPHRWSKAMVAVDIRNAFGQTSFIKHVASRMELGLPTDAVDLIAELVEVESQGNGRCLPQGAPTSPVIFNLACARMDNALIRVAGRVNGQVTRFVDNITLSVPDMELGLPLVRALQRCVEHPKRREPRELRGFGLNREKTIIVRRGNRAGVPLRLPGLIVIGNEINLPPRLIRRFRMMLWCAGKAFAKAHSEGSREGMLKALGVYAAIKGLIVQIYAGWPPQLAEVWPRAHGLTASTTVWPDPQPEEPERPGGPDRPTTLEPHEALPLQLELGLFDEI